MDKAEGNQSDSSESDRPTLGRAGIWLFASASFAAACLIFLVQPMVGKRVLPWFGGAPAVWALCLAFYQTVLFAGYTYAHLLNRFARPAYQFAIHGVALGLAFLSLPVLPGESWKPDGSEDASLAILAALSAHVAPSFLVLAGTAPLVQSWFARGYPGRSPYPLYAVSNAGSLLALLSYPFLLEPRLSLTRTSQFWSVAFVVTGLAVLLCAWVAWRRSPTATTKILVEVETFPAPPVAAKQVGLWIGLSACAVALLMSVTNELCLDVASVPFLWILPLATYLVTFIVCFGSESDRRRSRSMILTACLLAFQIGLGPWSNIESNFSPIANAVYVQILVQCGLLYGACTLLHNELYRVRPQSPSLTLFYLCVSAGGALGGLFVGLAAPALFDGYTELPITLALSAGLLVLAWWGEPDAWLHARAPVWRWATAGTALLLVLAGLTQVLVWPSSDLLHRERSFFGVLDVREVGEGVGQQRHLYSGTTLHGIQLLGSPQSAVSYFGNVTGIGLALAGSERRPPRRVGIIGLGIGALAVYGRPGDHFRFYEIDPVVTWVARDSGYFSFLGQSAAEIEVVQGDGRIALENELEEPGRSVFDILIVDAFTSDAVPVHLLTRESLRIYLESLAPNGLLSFHLSSRHFDLVPVVGRLAEDAGIEMVVVQNELLPNQLSNRATWVFLSRNARRLDQLERAAASIRRTRRLPPDSITAKRFVPPAGQPNPLWSDDYTDLFGALLPLPIEFGVQSN